MAFLTSLLHIMVFYRCHQCIRNIEYEHRPGLGQGLTFSAPYYYKRYSFLLAHIETRQAWYRPRWFSATTISWTP
jgi:hypothetical protein